jgi:hypothetical protein
MEPRQQHAGADVIDGIAALTGGDVTDASDNSTLTEDAINTMTMTGTQR